MKHWTETDFRNWTYGLREQDQHVAECPECRTSLERLAKQRERIIAEPEVSPEFLAAQRRRIYQRLEEHRWNNLPLRWVLSAAMLLVMVAGITFQQLHKPPAAISDEQLFSDLSSIEQTAEPKAIQPIHNLFEP